MAKKKQKTILEEVKTAKTPDQMAKLQRGLLAAKTLLSMEFEKLAEYRDSPEKRKYVHRLAVQEKKVKTAMRIVDLRLQRLVKRKPKPPSRWKMPKRLRKK